MMQSPEEGRAHKRVLLHIIGHTARAIFLPQLELLVERQMVVIAQLLKLLPLRLKLIHSG
ncbi:hypothetical protein D1872_352130 [compost metagenome]